jgi:putative transposase
MYVPGYPYHVTQRGNNRCTCFFDEQDYRRYLKLLEDVMPRYGTCLHAFVLMGNHIHLLLTPEDSDSISNTMRVVGSRYAAYINKKYERTGTLWEGRHFASAIDSERYLLACYRYIEMNPVRAAMVPVPEAYVWSSFRVNALGGQCSFLSAHAVYLALASSQSQRQQRYRALFAGEQSTAELGAIRYAAARNTALGSSAFKRKLESELGRLIKK